VCYVKDMPHTKSAKKRLRQSKLRHLQNRATKSFLHTLKRKFYDACTINKIEDAEKLLRELSSSFQKAAKRGIIHRNNARRNISRLSLRLQRLKTLKQK
jgi:small subunit ribosomal protein S20